MKRLFQAKTNINATIAKYDDKIALQVATKDEYLNVIKKLLQVKTNINTTIAKYSDRIAL